MENYKKGIDSLVYAVCGSGKTEIVLNVISYVIAKGEKVGFCVPRRDVAIELYERFKNILFKTNITLVYGGHKETIDGDLIICTTHQLYRYENFFDLLIIDEVDAFPFKGNDVLHAFFKKAVIGHYIMLSATTGRDEISQFEKEGGNVLYLQTRYHKHPLPVPQIIITNRLLMYYRLIIKTREYVKNNKQIFVFTPTIDDCESLFAALNLFVKKGDYVHSKKSNREETIERFKNKELVYLVTTAVLERGVTVKDLQVIVFKADHRIYDRASLIQIAGRVGRKKDAPEGEVIFYGKRETSSMQEAVRDIKKSNTFLQNMLQTDI